MLNTELQTRTSELLNQLSEIKNEQITATLFNTFIGHLKSEATSLVELTNNQEIQNQLTELSNFKSFDELTLIGRFFVQLLVFKFQLNWLDNWKNTGKYTNDLHNVELKLRGIQFKLQNNQ